MMKIEWNRKDDQIEEEELLDTIHNSMKKYNQE